MTRFFLRPLRWAAIACLLLLTTACGGDDDATPADGVDDAEAEPGATGSGDTDPGETDSGDTDSGETDSGDTDSGETDSGDTDSGETDSGDEPSAPASEASGSVTIDGATYEFSDVTECEVGGDFGPEWRSFIAFDDGGHNYVRITHAAEPDDWMTSLDLSVGLQNARTLDEGNPDQEWTTGMGGSVAATLSDTGAEGTAEVTDLDVVEGAVDATASWSFSC